MISRAFLQTALIGAFVLFLSFQGVSYGADTPAAPEPDTGLQASQSAIGSRFMVVSAHPEATRAGYEVLKRGGTAADAAVAVQLVLGLVEPQSSGLGGGAFALYYDAATGKVTSLDGRETAPMLSGKHLFTGEDGKPMEFYDAAIGGRAVGTPGVPALLQKLHKDHGKMAWRDLFTPAIALSERGFRVTPRLSKMLEAEKRRFGTDVKTKLYFYPDVSNPLPAGDSKRNPEYAITLRTLALEGAKAFYQGKMAEDIVAKVRDVKSNPSQMTVEDLAGYKVKERAPVCGFYRKYKICSMGEPSSGGLTLLETLAMLERFDLRSLGPESAVSWHLIAEASRLAFADRSYYMADADFVKTPGVALLDRSYLNSRSALISEKGPMKSVAQGTPPGWQQTPRTNETGAPKPPGTSHISIVDSYGNIVSMTTSIENAFGSRLMVDGFLLNNQLTDFAFVPEVDGKPVANAPAGNKRPRSSMAPTIVFDPQGKPFMVIGSAGGSRIIGFVLERIIAAIDWDKDMRTAMDMPNILHRGESVEVEPSATHLATQIKDIGHPVVVQPMNSGLTGIRFQGGLLIGAADPRRDGLAMGE